MFKVSCKRSKDSSCTARDSGAYNCKFSKNGKSILFLIDTRSFAPDIPDSVKCALVVHRVESTRQPYKKRGPVCNSECFLDMYRMCTSLTAHTSSELNFLVACSFKNVVYFFH